MATHPRLGPIFGALVFIGAETCLADTLTFQPGDGGTYSQTDATVIASTLNYNWGNLDRIGCATYTQSLIRFPSFIGDDPGQVPPGATISAASLTLTMYGLGLEAAPADIHAVFVPWDENTVTGPAFYARPGTLYGPVVASLPAGDRDVAVSADITMLVQGWVNGIPNFGLMLRMPAESHEYINEYFSDDEPVQSRRPKLTVTFTAPAVAVEPTTWGKVKALYR